MPEVQRQAFRGAELVPQAVLRDGAVGARQVNENTTPNFHGLAAIMEPASSWAAKWRHLSAPPPPPPRGCIHTSERMLYDYFKSNESEESTSYPQYTGAPFPSPRASLHTWLMVLLSSTTVLDD